MIAAVSQRFGGWQGAQQVVRTRNRAQAENEERGLWVTDVRQHVDKFALRLEAALQKRGDVLIGANRCSDYAQAALVGTAVGAPHVLAQLRNPLRRGARATAPCPRLGRLELDTSAARHNFRRDVVRSAGAVRAGNDEDVIQKRDDKVVRVQALLDFVQGLVLTQTVQVRHQWVALFAAFGLVDGVRDASIIRPVVFGRTTVELADEGHQGRRHFHQLAQHGFPADVIEGAEPVELQDDPLVIQFRQKTQKESQRIGTGARAERELVRRARGRDGFLLLLDQRPSDQAAKR